MVARRSNRDSRLVGHTPRRHAAPSHLGRQYQKDLAGHAANSPLPTSYLTEAKERSRCMSRISLTVNGRQVCVNVDPETPLLFVLNDELGLKGPHFGCGMAQCGACTVIMSGQVVRSCVMPVGKVSGRELTTLEGLGTPQHPH